MSLPLLPWHFLKASVAAIERRRRQRRQKLRQRRLHFLPDRVFRETFFAESQTRSPPPVVETQQPPLPRTATQRRLQRRQLGGVVVVGVPTAAKNRCRLCQPPNFLLRGRASAADQDESWRRRIIGDENPPPSVLRQRKRESQREKGSLQESLSTTSSSHTRAATFLKCKNSRRRPLWRCSESNPRNPQLPAVAAACSAARGEEKPLKSSSTGSSRG